jgi:hypothetical protein
VADASLTIIDGVLHIASAPNPGDGLALAVGVTCVDALLEGGATCRTDVSAGMIVTTLNGEVAASLGVILVVDAGQSLGNLRGRNSGSSGRSGPLGSPDATVIAQAAESVLEVASAVVETGHSY